MRKKIRQIFITGLVVTLPLGFTLYVLFFIMGLMDGLFYIMPDRYHPDALLGYHIPGLGIIATLVLVFSAGVVVKSYMGNKLMVMGENLLYRIPVIRSIYEGTKKVMDSLFVNKNRSFKKVVLVTFPHPGSYALGFVTGETLPALQSGIDRPCLNVFVPTTPNPTSGYLLMVPEQEVTDVDLTVEEAVAYIISCGIVHGPRNGAIKH